MPLEHLGDGLSISLSRSRERTEFLVELVSAAGHVDDQDLRHLIGQVEKGVGQFRRQIRKAAGFKNGGLVTATDLES